MNSHAQWCRMVVRMLKPGGQWGVPRSGLVFTKTGEDELTLTERLDFISGVEDITPADVAFWQQGDFETISFYMGQAGVTILDKTEPPIESNDG